MDTQEQAYAGERKEQLERQDQAVENFYNKTKQDWDSRQNPSTKWIQKGLSALPPGVIALLGLVVNRMLDIVV